MQLLFVFLLFSIVFPPLSQFNASMDFSDKDDKKSFLVVKKESKELFSTENLNRISNENDPEFYSIFNKEEFLIYNNAVKSEKLNSFISTYGFSYWIILISAFIFIFFFFSLSPFTIIAIVFGGLLFLTNSSFSSNFIKNLKQFPIEQSKNQDFYTLLAEQNKSFNNYLEVTDKKSPQFKEITKFKTNLADAVLLKEKNSEFNAIKINKDKLNKSLDQYYFPCINNLSSYIPIEQLNTKQMEQKIDLDKTYCLKKAQQQLISEISNTEYIEEKNLPEHIQIQEIISPSQEKLTSLDESSIKIKNTEENLKYYSNIKKCINLKLKDMDFSSSINEIQNKQIEAAKICKEEIKKNN